MKKTRKNADNSNLGRYARRRAGKGETHKQAVSIRLSPEVIAYFKSKGAGWQTRINDALEALIHIAQ